MSHIKYLVKNIPVLGYLIRFIFSLVLLPRNLSRLHNDSIKAKRELSDLQQNVYSANLKIIELNEEIVRLANLERKKSRKSK